MILFLCFVCPPLAVLMMGRPFSAFYNGFLLCLFWIPGVKHALAHYADYKHEMGVKKVVNAVDNPKWVQQRYTPQEPERPKRLPKSQHTYTPPLIDDPGIGANGTVFKRKA